MRSKEKHNRRDFDAPVSSLRPGHTARSTLWKLNKRNVCINYSFRVASLKCTILNGSQPFSQLRISYVCISHTCQTSRTHQMRWHAPICFRRRFPCWICEHIKSLGCKIKCAQMNRRNVFTSANTDGSPWNYVKERLSNAAVLSIGKLCNTLVAIYCRLCSLQFHQCHLHLKGYKFAEILFFRTY